MKVHVALIAAALTTASALPALAQQRVDTRVDNNQVLDANTRVGSGGYNAPRINNGVTADQIVTGNVTGGRGFRGPVTSDPRQFQQGAFSPSDRFIRQSNPVGAGGAPIPGNYVQPVYSGRTFAPPPGFVYDPYSGQYLQNTSMVRGTADIQYNLPPGAAIPQKDARGSTVLFNGDGRLPTLMASPLLGMRAYDQLSDQDLYLLAKNPGDKRLKNLNDGADLDIATIRRLREEMRLNMIGQPNAVNNRINQLKSDRLDDSISNGAKNPAELGSPIDRNAGLVPAISLSDAMPTVSFDGSPLPNGVRQGQKKPADSKERLAANDSVTRNKTVAEARKKMAAQPKSWLSMPPTAGAAPASQPADDAAKDFTLPATPATPQGPQPTGDLKIRPAPGAVDAPKLSAGQSQEGLRRLLESAETLMVNGKYATAAQRYDAALQVSANDPTILLGRAQANLGAGLFAKAAADLRAAYNADASMLLVKTDVVAAIGQRRMEKIVTDLKGLAVENKSDPMPLMMLAYIAHNSQAAARSGALLDAAIKVAPKDPVLMAMRNAWAK